MALVVSSVRAFVIVWAVAMLAPLAFAFAPPADAPPPVGQPTDGGLPSLPDMSMRPISAR